MTKNRLILESAFSSNAKLYLYIIFGIIFFPALLSVPLAFIGMVIGQNESIGFTIILRLVIVCLIVILAVLIFPLKKGLLKNESGLHFGYFTWGKPIYKYKISLEGAEAISILKFKRRQRGAYLSEANPEYSSAFDSFEVYALNENHTERKIIIPLKMEKNALKAVEFITQHTGLKEEIYSPDFS